jgi:hypothetical protein
MSGKSLSISLRPCAIILLLFPFFAQVCQGETLYERSLSQFQAKALKVAPDDFTFVVLGDSRNGDALFRNALQLAKSFEPLFILHGGDYSDSGEEAQTARFLRLVNENLPEVPLFVVMGNHENREVFVKKIGPLDFTLESKRLGLTLVAVDNSDYALRGAERNYLKTRLATAFRSVFVAMHIPPKTERWSWHTFSEGAADLKQILATGRVQGAFFSHMHLFDRSEFGGVPAIVTGGAGAPLYGMGFPDNAVHHIVVVRVKNGKAGYRMVPLSK